VDGANVKTAHLREGQTVTIGPYHLRFRDRTLEFQGRGLSVSCRGLTFRPPGFAEDLLHDLNLRIEPGTFLALVGTSGAGKSTLMKLLAGLTHPTSGEVFYNERPRASPEFRRAVGWVPQQEIVHAHLRVNTALSFSARLRLPDGTASSEIERRVRYAAEQVTLSHRLESPILRLSGGERKRVALAAEELGDPDIFFLDEPTSGLDPGLEKEIMLSLRDLARRGRTVILITHATDNILLCDRLLFLAPGGHPVFSGPPAEATERFGVTDFAEIYRLLTSPRWFGEHGLALAEKTRAELAREVEVDQKPATPKATASERPRYSLLRQLGLLLSREAFLTAADRSNLALLVFQAPIIGLILGQLFGSDTFSLSQHLNAQAKYPVMDAPILLFMLVVSSLFFGAVNSCRELVMERSIFIRERLLGVRPEIYLLSKVITLGVKGLFSVGLLLMIVAWLVPLPWTEAEAVQALLLCWATYLGGVGLGLTLSALVGSSEQAGTLVTVILILQLVLSGAFVKPEQMTSPISELSVLAICRWSFAGLAHISEINHRFAELGLPFVTADFYLPLNVLWLVLGPLLALHLVAPLCCLYLRKDQPQ
jgi:ABC-type multidrug transport system ATPase subunit